MCWRRSHPSCRVAMGAERGKRERKAGEGEENVLVLSFLVRSSSAPDSSYSFLPDTNTGRSSMTIEVGEVSLRSETGRRGTHCLPPQLILNVPRSNIPLRHALDERLCLWRRVRDGVVDLRLEVVDGGLKERRRISRSRGKEQGRNAQWASSTIADAVRSR
jgi:hypothetical protein